MRGPRFGEPFAHAVILATGRPTGIFVQTPEVLCKRGFFVQSRQYTPPPAVMAGLTDRLWTMDDLLDAVTKHVEWKRKADQIDKLLKKLRSV